MLRLALTAVAAAAITAAVGCTALVSFVDQPVGGCDGSCDATTDDGGADGEAGQGEVGACDGKAEGDPCGLDDACHDAPTCTLGICTPHPKADGVGCAPPKDACHSTPVCKSGVCGSSNPLPDGTPWLAPDAGDAGDDTARCCGGAPVRTDSMTNCGVCGIECDATQGQTCQLVGGHYFCAPCSANTACWSTCCSMSVSSHCAPSICASGSCNLTICPGMSHCVPDALVNYCSY